MSKVYVISDLHLGHKAAIKFREGFNSIEEHDGYIEAQWHSVITKQDNVYVLGDIAWTKEHLLRLRNWPGQKFLVRGNHDVWSTYVFLTVFEQIYGLFKYKNKCWMSHAPIHPDELRGRPNVHGHVHSNLIKDTRNYKNVCCENTDYAPVLLDQVIEEGWRGTLGDRFQL